MKVKLGEKINFTGVTYRSMGKRLLIGEERLKDSGQLQNCCQCTKAGVLEHTVQSTQNLTGWRTPLLLMFQSHPTINTIRINNQQENLLSQGYMFQHAGATDMTQRQNGDPAKSRQIPFKHRWERFRDSYGIISVIG